MTWGRAAEISPLHSSDRLGHHRYASLAQFGGKLAKISRDAGANIGSFVFDAAGAAVASPFRLAGQLYGSKQSRHFYSPLPKNESNCRSAHFRYFEMITDNSRRAQTSAIEIWLLRILLSLVLLLAAFKNLSRQPEMVIEFDIVGLGLWFRYLTGDLELLGGLAILVPQTSIFGSLLLLTMDVGAFVAQVAILHMDRMHCIVIGALLGVVIYIQRSKSASKRRHEKIKDAGFQGRRLV